MITLRVQERLRVDSGTLAVAAAPLELYAAYPQRRHLPATIRAFIDHLTEAAGTLHVARSGQ
ncbi:hypothetical protein WL28_07000 [Burkholderia ubonensis]|uniref:hypothetical protein n=1 Tax=Burkholderia ubonensis TaxID=101571 RepID=UPI000751E819|nr:hypothetical protein [Burkholderia ubonensis]KVD14083.1 hypothetical protein WI81_18745 [Burkholderia ubonensis]KWA74433.1 hypothetical protein WL28_07000 [Burkholderia ubonensis]